MIDTAHVIDVIARHATLVDGYRSAENMVRHTANTSDDSLRSHGLDRAEKGTRRKEGSMERHTEKTGEHLVFNHDKIGLIDQK